MEFKKIKKMKMIVKNLVIMILIILLKAIFQDLNKKKLEKL